MNSQATDTIKSLCESFVERAKKTKMSKGKRDQYALEYFNGAAMALHFAGHAEANEVVAFTAIQVGTKGFAAVEQVAAGE